MRFCQRKLVTGHAWTCTRVSTRNKMGKISFVFRVQPWISDWKKTLSPCRTTPSWGSCEKEQSWAVLLGTTAWLFVSFLVSFLLSCFERETHTYECTHTEGIKLWSFWQWQLEDLATETWWPLTQFSLRALCSKVGIGLHPEQDAPLHQSCIGKRTMNSLNLVLAFHEISCQLRILRQRSVCCNACRPVIRRQILLLWKSMFPVFFLKKK